jgi:anti-anti-sigma regulatory factor
MTEQANLRVASDINEATNTLQLAFTGDIDVTAGAVFDALPDVPPGYQVVLDFAAVVRVNSMGLAQLMRCLEDWKTAGIETQAINLNRMVSMLFKMTGLNRYFGGANAEAGDTTSEAFSKARAGAPKVASKQAATTAGSADNPAVKDKTPRNRSPQFRRVKRNTAQAPEKPSPVPLGKLSFSVSLQSNQQLSGWYFLNTLLQRRLGRPMSMTINQLGKSTALHESSLVFAKPFDACALIADHGFIPVVRPVNDTVEVSIVVRSEDSHKAIHDFDGAAVATSTEASFVFLLGRFFCDEYELDSAKLRYQFTGSQLTAIRRLLDKEVDLLFMQKNNYALLSELSRQGTHLLEQSDTGMAYHLLLVSPAAADLQPQLVEIFSGLQNDTQGTHALQDLGIEAWCEPEPDEIAMLQMLYGRYVTA